MRDVITHARAVLARSASAPWSADGRDDATHRGMVVLADGADQIVGTVNGNDPYEHAFADSDVDAIVLSRNTIEALLDALHAAQNMGAYCERHGSPHVHAYCPDLRADRTPNELRGAVDRALEALRVELERLGR